jgi:hypothetical protein
MKIQCLYYALDKWNETGGYLLFRKSVHWCMPHVLHLNPKTGLITHYVPPEKLKYPWYSMFGFEGYIKTGDDDNSPPIHPLCMGLGTVALFIFGCIWLFKRNTIRRNRRRYERRAQPRDGGSDRRRC